MAQMTETRTMGGAPVAASERPATVSGRVVNALRGKPALTTGLLLLPGTLWMLLFVGTSLVSIVVFSFWTSGFTGLRPEYTLANYQSLLKPGSSFWAITAWTLQVVALLLLGVIVLSYPVSYALWRVIKSPYWKSALWLLFIVFMVGPIYFAMQRIDEDVMSAAAVYGAGPWRTFFQVVVPLTLPGLMAGSLFVVVLGLAEFFTERAIGGAQSPMLAGLIQRQIDVFQFAGAAAVAVSLIVITLV